MNVEQNLGDNFQLFQLGIKTSFLESKRDVSTLYNKSNWIIIQILAIVTTIGKSSKLIDRPKTRKKFFGRLASDRNSIAMRMDIFILS